MPSWKGSIFFSKCNKNFYHLFTKQRSFYVFGGVQFVNSCSWHALYILGMCLIKADHVGSTLMCGNKAGNNADNDADSEAGICMAWDAKPKDTYVLLVATLD